MWSCDDRHDETWVNTGVTDLKIGVTFFGWKRFHLPNSISIATDVVRVRSGRNWRTSKPQVFISDIEQYRHAQNQRANSDGRHAIYRHAISKYMKSGCLTVVESASTSWWRDPQIGAALTKTRAVMMGLRTGLVFLFRPAEGIAVTCIGGLVGYGLSMKQPDEQ